MVGESNLLARSACKALATGDSTFGNCLFMNSSTGLGKSHLTQAVVHQVLRSAPATRLHYLTAQQFSAEMVKGIRANTMEQFSKKYVNNCDMLLVEDVHTLTGKNKTQEELNTILDYLIKSGRRVILTSALPPNKLPGIDDDFRSRMTSGLVTGIESPDYETRARIIRHKLQLHGLDTDEDLVGFMAENLRGTSEGWKVPLWASRRNPVCTMLRRTSPWPGK
jgi:chromosomal replication initiator protein